MAELGPIALLLLTVAVGYAIFLWTKLSKIEASSKDRGRAIDEKDEELEKLRRDLKDKREDAEQAKKQLQEARNKLKKQEKQEKPAPGHKREKSFEAEPAAAASAAAVVRITDQQLEEEHRRAMEKLEAALEEARRDLQDMKRREREIKAEADRAAKSLDTAVAAPVPVAAEPAPVMTTPTSESEQIALLKSQLDAMKRATLEREKELRRELRRSQEAASGASKRATNNHQLYQVIKGQLELAEDRLAALRLKYEGAMTPDEIRREQKKVERTRAVSNGSSAASLPRAEVEEAAHAAPSTIEVSKDQIVGSEPASSPPVAEELSTPPPAED
jgi:hypothetical protein